MIMAAVSCNPGNPFLAEWDTPYGIPDFTKVQEEHYIPAIEYGIQQQQSEIDAIISNTEAPTFANVVEAYERSGAVLDRVSSVLFNVSESDATESLQKIVEQGNTVIVIEHNLDVLKSVDYLFDMGPEGGKAGGMIVASGTPEQLANNPDSVTGPFLKEVL